MPARLTAGRTALMMSSWSSGGKRPGMLPDESRSFMKTRKRSSVICESVNRNEMPSPLTPAFLYMIWRSLRRSLTPYVAEMTIWKTVKPATKVASLESDCLPMPPTPTSSACPPGDSMMREMRATCRIASSKSTRSMTALMSLYSPSAPVSSPDRSAKVPILS